MSKRDYIWIALRIFTIYLLILTIRAVPEIITSAYNFCQFRNLAGYSDLGLTGSAAAMGKSLERYQDNLVKTQLSTFVHAVSQFVIFGGISIYLLRGGTLLHKWIYPPDTAHESTKVA